MHVGDFHNYAKENFHIHSTYSWVKGALTIGDVNAWHLDCAEKDLHSRGKLTKVLQVI